MTRSVFLSRWPAQERPEPFPMDVLRSARQTGRMKTFTGLVAVLVVLSPAAAAAQMNSYMLVGKKTIPAFAWCDAPDRVLAVTAPPSSLSGPQDVQPVTLLRWLKNKPQQAGSFNYKLGPTEGATGSSFYGLVPAGFKATPELSSKYFVQLSNVQQPPEYRMRRVVQFKTMQGGNTCRYVPNAAFMGVTAKRTVIVWDEGDVITYATRNFGGGPGAFVTGGRKQRTQEGGTFYTFATEDGYSYRLTVDEYGSAGGARLDVQRNGKRVLKEPFLAYSVSQSLR